MADERGAPTDFGGAVFPNPDNVAPVLDTEIGPPQKTNANINNAPLDTQREYRQRPFGQSRIFAQGAIPHRSDRGVP